MKKILSLVLVLAVMLIMPFAVKADMGAPNTKPFDMVVINPNGIEYYENQYDENTHEWNKISVGKLKKDTVFTVTSGFNNEYNIEVNEKHYVLTSLDGSGLVSEEFTPKEEDNYVKKLNKKGEVLVYVKSGVALKKGPADIYKSVATIKKGTKLTYQYYIGEGNIDSAAYVYVSYNGKKGWIDTLNSKVLFKNEDEEYVTRTDVKLSCATIPRNTIIKPTYISDQWTSNIMIKYGDCTKLLETNSFEKELLYARTITGKTKKELDLYEYNNNGGKKLVTIPSGSDIKHIATYSEEPYSDKPTENYISYNGINGWVIASYDDYELNYDNVVDTPTTTTTTKATTTPAKVEKTTPDNFVLMCIIAGGSVALAAIIIIILVNKKKKSKKVDKKEEKANEDEE